MKVLLVNGSPHKEGCTFTALSEVAETLNREGVDTEIFWIGSKPEDVKQDLEGLQIMRVLARNMAWFLKCKEIGIRSGLPFPEREDPVLTNFVR